MKEYPQFSVVIPMYNMKSYIVPVLDAIYSQTILPEEIIIVDDGSKDGSSEEVTKFISSCSLFLSIVKNIVNFFSSFLIGIFF